LQKAQKVILEGKLDFMFVPLLTKLFGMQILKLEDDADVILYDSNRIDISNLKYDQEDVLFT
jgi:hypothetical protein